MFFYFLDIWVLRNQNFPAKKKQKKTFVNGLAGTHNTYANNHGLSPKNGGDFWTFVRKNMCNLRSCLCHCVVSVWDQPSTWNMTWYWPYAIRSPNICMKLTDMSWSSRTYNRFVQKRKGGNIYFEHILYYIYYIVYIIYSGVYNIIYILRSIYIYILRKRHYWSFWRHVVGEDTFRH